MVAIHTKFSSQKNVHDNYVHTFPLCQEKNSDNEDEEQPCEENQPLSFESQNVS